MKIVADNTVPYLKGIAEPIAEVKYLTSKEFTPENVQDADALIVRSIDKCTRELLEGSRVKLITSATIGFDHIDTRYCDEAGIAWKNSPGCNAVSVAQYVLAGLITIALRKGEALQGKTIGIVGVGHVGKEVEKLCTAYGMNVLRNDLPRAEAEGENGFVSLDTIAEQADIVTFHTPLTKEGRFATRHLAGEDFFCKLQRTPWFINASRGAVHDTDALLRARREGKIGELILDCWENEPDINRELLGLAAIATPHIAGFSADGKANGTRMCLKNIERFFRVKIDKIDEVVPPAPVNPIIDLDRFDGKRIEQAILTSFNPLAVDRALRENPDKFEWFRANYHHPREYQAYTIVHATPEEAGLLQKLGFGIQQ
ncbi:4-phosphoerythronate dehydrogenase PdxB [uncultured Parabacteroides sp.]|uniref:4-phosphoerythronate dehydrogenase PdxB n=1 Tax=uncultured Parabacteroides sp. TaxID=512312 RepID=UPI0025EBF724|nr:4-phosphoerythronate dehydrogenase PdxB [uncultured Parabacteroides sp.]